MRAQDSPDFNATGYDLLQDSFGLLDKSPSRWSTFRSAVARLNAEADEHTTYKVIYIARHGQGWHNVAEGKYGTPEWNRLWSRLEGDGKMVVRVRLLALQCSLTRASGHSGVPTPFSRL